MKHNDFFEDTQKKVSIVHRNLLYSENGPEIFEWEKDLEPTLRIGAAVVKGGAKGHAIKHGTEEDKRRRWAEYQRYIDDQHCLHPSFSYNFLMHNAAKKFGKHISTIKRHTKNPKNSKKSS